jgi:hypothetical protein
VSQLANISVPHLIVNQAAGQDSVTIRGSVLDSLFADLGDDNDSLTIESSSIYGGADVSGGTGASDLLADRSNLFGAALVHELFESFG